MTNQNHLSFRILRSILLVASILYLSQSLTQAASGDDGWSNQFFQSGFNDTVSGIVSDSQGNIYAVGRFAIADDVIASHIAKWDGHTWDALGSGFNKEVSDLAVDSNDNIYAIGPFTEAGGVSAKYIAKWNGVEWSALGSGLHNGYPQAIVIDQQDRVYVGGHFSGAGEVSVSYLARWDGTNWSDVSGGVNSTVFSLVVDSNNDLYVGTFAAPYLSKWDGTSWQAVSGVLSKVFDIALDKSDRLYISTTVVSNSGNIATGVARRSGDGWEILGTPNKNTYDLQVDAVGNVYVSGTFTAISGVSARYLAKWDGAEWRDLGNGLNNYVDTMLLDGQGNLYIAGSFVSVGDIQANYIAKWDGANWAALGSSAAAGLSDGAESLAVDSKGNVYAGVVTYNKSYVYNLARWDGNQWSNLGGGLNDWVKAVAVDSDDNVYAGGSFTMAGNTAANRIVQWNGSNWLPLGSGVNGLVRAIATDGQNNLYVSGDFTSAGGVNAYHIAKWDGNSWSALGDGIDGLIYALVVDSNGNLYVGGSFTAAGGIPANGFAVWDGVEWSALVDNMSQGYIRDLAIDSKNNVYAVGAFNPEIAGRPKRVAKWESNGWSVFNHNILSQISSIIVDREDNLYIGGYFTSIDDEPFSLVSRWNGTAWEPLGSGIRFDDNGESTTYVDNLAISNEDVLYASGYFFIAGGKAAFNFARWIESPILIVSPTSLNFSATVGEINPPAQTFVIDDNNDGELPWTISEDLPWLSVDQENGEQSSEINVSVDANGLSIGTYTGQITVSATGTENSPQTVAVTLVVAPAPPEPPLALTAEAGPTTIFLDWEYSRNPGVTTYRISRSADEGQTFAPIGTTFDLYYEDSDDMLLHNNTYCYQIEALQADESVVNTSTVACAVFGQTALWVPRVRAETKHTVIVPINIRNAGGLRITNSTIWLDYDQNMLYPVEVIATPLTAGYDWSYDITHVAGKPGFKRMHINASTDTPAPLYGNGSLFWLKFDVFAERGDKVTLDLREYIAGVGGSAIYTPENPTSPIPIIVQDGRLSIDYTYLLGDVDGNGEVENADADLALEIAAGAVTPRAEQLYAGDINGSGSIEAADATMILHYITYGDWPVDLIEATGLAALSAAPVQLRLDDVAGLPGTVVETTLRAENLSDWAGGRLAIVYDPAVISKVTGLTPTGLAADFTVQFSDDQTGTLQVALANDMPVSGTGELLKLGFRLAADAPDGTIPLVIAKAQLNDLNGRDFATSALQQAITRNNATVQIDSGNTTPPPPADPDIAIYLPIVVKD